MVRGKRYHNPLNFCPNNDITHSPLLEYIADLCNSPLVHMESDNTGSLDQPELVISQGFELPWDHRNAPVLPLKLATFFLDNKSGSCNSAYTLMEFQRINKQMATKSIVDYFLSVCDAKIMHERFCHDRISTKSIYHHILCLAKH